MLILNMHSLVISIYGEHGYYQIVWGIFSARSAAAGQPRVGWSVRLKLKWCVLST